MSTFQKIRFVLTKDQLIDVLMNSGAINGLVLDLSVKENYVTVIDVNGFAYATEDKIVITGSSQSAIPTPPGAHGDDVNGVETIDLKTSSDEALQNFFKSTVPFAQPKSFDNLA